VKKSVRVHGRKGSLEKKGKRGKATLRFRKRTDSGIPDRPAGEKKKNSYIWKEERWKEETGPLRGDRSAPWRFARVVFPRTKDRGKEALSVMSDLQRDARIRPIAFG